MTAAVQKMRSPAAQNALQNCQHHSLMSHFGRTRCRSIMKRQVCQADVKASKGHRLTALQDVEWYLVTVWHETAQQQCLLWRPTAQVSYSAEGNQSEAAGEERKEWTESRNKSEATAIGECKNLTHFYAQIWAAGIYLKERGSSGHFTQREKERERDFLGGAWWGERGNGEGKQGDVCAVNSKLGGSTEFHIPK